MSSTSRPLRWGILGTGKIARLVAGALAGSDAGELVAVGSRSPERSNAFAEAFSLRGSHGGYEAVIEDPDVEVVYVATYHPDHREWAILAAEAGKHLLCEKPLALTRADADAVVEAARRNDVFLLEAFAYRCHPQTRRLLELLRSGAIGEVRVVDAAFGYDAGPNPGNYLLVHELAGGSILDVGCYPTSMAHLVARTALGSVTEPADVFGVAELGPTGVDHYASAVLRFDGGVMARVASSIRVDIESSLRVFGSRGQITVPSPWLPRRIGGRAEIVVQRAGSQAEVERVEPDGDEYRIEVDAVADMVRGGERSPAVMPWEESLANMATLDRWRASAGVRYEQDEVAAAGAGRAASGR